MSKKEEKKGMTEAELNALKNEELTKRATAFNEELIPLLAKYKLGLGGSAFLMPDGRVAARPQLFDDSNPKPQAKVEDNNIDLPQI